MEALIVFIVSLALAFPVLAIASIVIANGTRGELRKLQFRIAALEAGGAHPASTTAAVSIAPVVEETPPADEAATVAPAEPAPAATEPAAEPSRATPP